MCPDFVPALVACVVIAARAEIDTVIAFTELARFRHHKNKVDHRRFRLESLEFSSYHDLEQNIARTLFRKTGCIKVRPPITSLEPGYSNEASNDRLIQGHRVAPSASSPAVEAALFIPWHFEPHGKVRV